MIIFQPKFRTLKIIQPVVKTLLFMLLISATFISCNTKKDASDDNEKEKVADNKKEKAFDADHTFDIRLVKDSEIIEFSGSVPSDEGGAIYNDQKSVSNEKGDRDRTIMMFIGKKYNRGAAGVFGIFRIDENWKPITHIQHAVKNASNLSIRPEENGNTYSAISGTLTFSNLKFVLPMPNNGAASFSLEFEGDFQKDTTKEDIFQGSGTIVLSPKRQMGIYKAK